MRLPPGQGHGLEAEYRAQRVRELLTGFKFLQVHPGSLYFSSSFIEHFVLDVLTLSPFHLCTFVQVNNMNNLFSLVGATIIATLHDFFHGNYDPLDLDNERWHEYYVQVKQTIIGMRQAQLSDWLNHLQANLLTRACTSLGLLPFTAN